MTENVNIVTSICFDENSKITVILIIHNPSSKIAFYLKWGYEINLYCIKQAFFYLKLYNKVGNHRRGEFNNTKTKM